MIGIPTIAIAPNNEGISSLYLKRSLEAANITALLRATAPLRAIVVSTIFKSCDDGVIKDENERRCCKTSSAKMSNRSLSGCETEKERRIERAELRLLS